MMISHSLRYNVTHQHPSNVNALKLEQRTLNPQFGIGPKGPVGVRKWRQYKLMMAALISTVTLGAAGAGYLIYQGLGKKEPAPTIQTPAQQSADDIDVTQKANP